MIDHDGISINSEKIIINKYHMLADRIHLKMKKS